MPPLKPLDQRLWRRQTNQCIWIILFSWSFFWGSCFYIPTTGRVYSKYWDFCGGEGDDDRGEGFADFAGKGETED
jgi:hypothetical protein